MVRNSSTSANAVSTILSVISVPFRGVLGFRRMVGMLAEMIQAMVSTGAATYNPSCRSRGLIILGSVMPMGRHWQRGSYIVIRRITVRFRGRAVAIVVNDFRYESTRCGEASMDASGHYGLTEHFYRKHFN